MDKFVLKTARNKNAPQTPSATNLKNAAEKATPTTIKKIHPKITKSKSPIPGPSSRIDPAIDIISPNNKEIEPVLAPEPDKEHELESNPAHTPETELEPNPTSVLEPESRKKKVGTKRKAAPANNEETEKKKIPSFNESWLMESQFKNWLQKAKDKDDSTVAYCKICSAQLVPHKSVLIKHSSSSRHISKIKDASTSVPIQKALQQKPLEEQTRRAELKLSSLVATKQLSFNLLETLTPLLSDIFPDSAIAKNMKLSRTKCQAMITQILGPELKKKIVEQLKNPGEYFSVIIDETTDITISKQCAMAIIYFDKNTNKVETCFFDLYEVSEGTGQNLYFQMIERIERERIPIQNIVGFASDTTNTMVGQHNSVFSHLKEKLPHIACVRCSCHSIHLVASKASAVLPRYVEDMLRNIGAHFNRSSLRQKRLKELQIFFQVDIHKILSPCTTRWLSLKACVDRILEQKVVLKEYFESELKEDRSHTTETIIQNLSNPYVIIYMEFMSYTLELFNDFNKMFQTEKPVLHELKPQVEKLLKTIAANYMEMAYIKRTDAFKLDYKNPGRFLPLGQVYPGVAAQLSIDELKKLPNPPEPEIEIILKKFLAFYIEAISEIIKKFTFEDPLYACIDIVDPKIAQSYRNKDLKNVINRFPQLKQHLSEQSLVKEWRDHALLIHENFGLSPDLPAEEYWGRVFSLKDGHGDVLYPNIKKMMSLLLVLPFSNACVERIFSNLKNTKSDHRNKLKTETISALMSTAEGVKDVKKFEPTKRMLVQKLQYKK